MMFLVLLVIVALLLTGSIPEALTELAYLAVFVVGAIALISLLGFVEGWRKKENREAQERVEE